MLQSFEFWVLTQSILPSSIHISFINLDVLLTSINDLTSHLPNLFNSTNFFPNFKFNGINLPFIPEYITRPSIITETMNNSSIIQGKLPIYIGSHYNSGFYSYSKFIHLIISSSLLIPFVGLGGRFLGNIFNNSKKDYTKNYSF